MGVTEVMWKRALMSVVVGYVREAIMGRSLSMFVAPCKAPITLTGPLLLVPVGWDLAVGVRSRAAGVYWCHQRL